MPNRRLTPEELTEARALLDEIRCKLNDLSRGDRELLFAYRRKIYKELVYDERDKPMIRRALKTRKRKEQGGLCTVCNKELPDRYTVLDRLNAVDGYTPENTRLIHQQCDINSQISKRYA